MGKCLRHFKSLFKKNFLVWSRRPICAFVEILMPIALMILLAWVRTEVPILKTDYGALEKYKHPVFPALKYETSELEGNSWVKDFAWSNEHYYDFMKYMGYAPRPPFNPFNRTELEGDSYFHEPIDAMYENLMKEEIQESLQLKLNLSQNIRFDANDNLESSLKEVL